MTEYQVQRGAVVAACRKIVEGAVSAARKRGLANIATGSIRRSPTLVRVTAQFVDGRDGADRWSQR